MLLLLLLLFCCRCFIIPRNKETSTTENCTLNKILNPLTHSSISSNLSRCTWLFLVVLRLQPRLFYSKKLFKKYLTRNTQQIPDFESKNNKSESKTKPATRKTPQTRKPAYFKHKSQD